MSMGAALGAQHVVGLDRPRANLQHAGGGRQWNGQIYVATPQLLQAFGITSSEVAPNAYILSMRPGCLGSRACS